MFAVLRVFHATFKGEITFPESYALPKKIRKQLGGVTIEREGWSRLFSFMEWETFTELSRKWCQIKQPNSQLRFVVDKHHLKDIAFRICGTRARGKGSDVNIRAHWL